MMWVYQILDIIGTLLETTGIYILVKAYCPNIKNKVASFIPPVVFFATTYIWTWFIEDVTFRLPVVLILTFLAYKVVTKEAAVNIIAGIMTQQVYLIAANALAETMSSHILNEMTVLVEGRQFLRPQVYILYFLLQIAFMLFFHYFMKKHSGGIDKKSLLAISISFFIIEVLAQTITIAFHDGRADWFNLNIELAAIAVAVLFVILLVYIKNYLYLREQEQRDKIQIAQLQQQFAYYQEKMKDEERVRSIYHDLKNHLLVMESRQNTEETRQMAETLRSQIADYEDYVHTGNEFLDIILKDKAAKAREKQIDFSAMVDFHGIDFMEALDVSTIFGNAIDNAIEASENLSEYKRLITVKAERIRDMLLITIENNTLPGNHLTDGTTKKDRFVHGFGIPNIKKAVEKYGGQCSFQQEESVYRLKILIPCP